MKAKNSLRALLWPLLKQIIRIKHQLLSSRKPQNELNDSLAVDLRQAAAESKRIAGKLHETEQLVAYYRQQNQPPAADSVSAKEADDKGNSQFLCGWREDEDDRYSSKDYSLPYHRQNHKCDDNQEIMKAILQAFFKADHDAVQYEQYRLENEMTLPAVQKPLNHLRCFINSGLKVFLTVVFILGAGSARLKGQEVKALQALQIGDTVPDITIQNIINYKSTSAKISDFEGKLLILDFWATWCSSCITKFPELGAIKQQFPGEVEFLLVNTKSTRDTEKKICDFLDKHRTVNGAPFGLPTTVNDTLLDALFPHQLIPHYVWIGADGIVKAITSADEVTSANISNILKGLRPQMSAKKDVDMTRPLFSSGDLPLSSMLQYSIFIKGRKEGLSTGSRYRNKDGISYGRAITNMPVLVMYDLTARELYPDLMIRNLIAEVKDISRLDPERSLSAKSEWEQDNQYSYELQVPLHLAGQLHEFILNDLNRYTDYIGMLEKRKMNCLVIKKTGSYQINTSEKKAAITLKRLNRIMNSEDGPGLPVVDETGLDRKTTIAKPENLKTRAAFNRYLKASGLYAEEAEREFEVFVLRDKQEK